MNTYLIGYECPSGDGTLEVTAETEKEALAGAKELLDRERGETPRSLKVLKRSHDSYSL